MTHVDIVKFLADFYAELGIVFSVIDGYPQ